MTVDELIEIFEEKSDDEYLEFKRVENKLSKRPDLHAFLLLDSLDPGTCDSISGAEHDEIYLDFSIEKVAKNATFANIVDLIRCGVRISGDCCFCMFA